MSQTIFTQDPAIGFVGELSNGIPFELKSGFAEGALRVGQPVFRGTDPDNQIRMAVLGDRDGSGNITPLGLCKLDKRKVNVGYADLDAAAYASKGRMFVVSEDACTAGDAVYVRVVAAGAEELGALRASADGTDTAVWVGARFVRSAGAGEVTEVEFDCTGN